MANNVHILYFAGLADKLGRTEESFELSSSNTVGELKAQLASRDQIWKDLILAPSTRCALNQQLANDDSSVSQGDEIAFFPPVTGG